MRDRGRDHPPRFTATVLVGGVTAGRGEDESKKEAQQRAASRRAHRPSPDWPTFQACGRRCTWCRRRPRRLCRDPGVYHLVRPYASTRVCLLR
ncbi:putative dsRNA-binding protein [Nocardia blacklockiae]|uniref:putative dsRNA-binding protein n=1 Tax=Nocardia blacklockiae TaxID=480036 RepID=UPI002B4ABFAB|nr:putative dsRNA-binding protein [Nocardia blacklockiae]